MEQLRRKQNSGYRKQLCRFCWCSVGVDNVLQGCLWEACGALGPSSKPWQKYSAGSRLVVGCNNVSKAQPGPAAVVNDAYRVQGLLDSVSWNGAAWLARWW